MGMDDFFFDMIQNISEDLTSMQDPNVLVTALLLSK